MKEMMIKLFQALAQAKSEREARRITAEINKAQKDNPK